MTEPAARTSRHTRTPSPARALVVGLALFALLAPVAGCTGSSDDDGMSREETAESSDRVSGSDLAGEAAGEASRAQEADPASESRAAPPGVPQKLIATGHVQLASTDVARTRAEARAVATAAGGQVQAEETAGDEGRTSWSHLTLRVPTERFEEAMERLAALGTRVSVDQSTEDVTSEVADTDVRVANQRRSLARLRDLLGRAATIGEVIEIEDQLARREADLAALEARQQVLADQTSLSTITVSIERRGEDDEPEETGFLAGLSAGWGSLAAFGTGLLSVTGLLLPWLVLVALLAVPGVPVARRLRGRAQSS